MSVRSLGADDAALLDRLIEKYPFNSYRNYRMLPRKRQAAVLKAEINNALGSPGERLTAVAGDGDRIAVAICRPQAWDTAFFGIPMARLDYVLRSEGADRSTVEEAVAAALENCRRAGIHQVSAKIDVADTDGIAVAEDHGFRLMDNLATYLHHPKRPSPPPVKAVGAIRPFVPGDADQIMEITREVYSGFRGRFHLDPRFSSERATEMYIEWARKCCTGQRARRLFVAMDSQGHLFGFLAMQLVEPVSSVGGVQLFAGVLGACRRDQPGAYLGLIHAATLENHDAGAATEGQTQNYNFSTVRIYEAIGAHYVRADYTFHAWLG